MSKQLTAIGSPEQVYHHPSTPFVHGFLGSVNVLKDAGSSTYVRPHDISLSATPDAAHPVPATVLLINAAGPAVRVDLTRSDDGQVVEAVVSHAERDRLDLAPGKSLHLGYASFARYAGASIKSDYTI